MGDKHNKLLMRLVMLTGLIAVIAVGLVMPDLIRRGPAGDDVSLLGFALVSGLGAGLVGLTFAVVIRFGPDG